MILIGFHHLLQVPALNRYL